MPPRGYIYDKATKTYHPPDSAEDEGEPSRPVGRPKGSKNKRPYKYFKVPRTRAQKAQEAGLSTPVPEVQSPALRSLMEMLHELGLRIYALGVKDGGRRLMLTMAEAFKDDPEEPPAK